MIKNMNKKLLLYLGIGIGSVILLIVILLIFKLLTGGIKYNSKQFETKLKEAATSYYKKEKKKLPKNDGDKVSVSIEVLVDAEYLKDPDKILKKGLTCDGGVNVSNNNGYYLYQPVIDCSDGYSTDLLYKKILKDNQIKTSGDGLYKIDNYYLFRGETLNNYVKFVNKNWQILRINEDNSIRIILIDNLSSVAWDDRYNTEKQDSVGKNIYEISRIKQTLDDYFNNKHEKIFTKEDKSLIVPTELCIGARNELSNVFDGSIECAKKTERLPLGLLQANEYPIISLDSECKGIYDSACKNYNFLGKLSMFWTLTADSKTTYNVYRVGGRIDSAFTDAYSQPRIVLNISSDALYNSGTGNINDPYIIK